jgi:nuclear factor of activated T-cells 5
MAKSGKRKQSLTSNSSQTITTNSQDIDDDSGFCGSNLSPTANKMVRFDEEILLLKELMKEVNEPLIDSSIRNINNTNKVVNYQPKSKSGKFELKILSQPEEQHRARYLTEGSRGAIKDKSGLSHPIVKLCGYNKGPVKIQCFIGHDKQIGSSHLFYQASKITGKNSTRCSTKKIDGTTVIVMDASPENDMQVTVDCVGILKERNVDVEQKLTRFKNKTDSECSVAMPTKKRSTRCRLVFRSQIPDTNEILQVVSTPILCTQPLGTPEICKKSLSQCYAKGGQELFIIGKNFLKDAKVIWKNSNWTKVVEPDKEFLHSTHLICMIPSYEGPELNNQSSVEVSLTIKSGGKFSDPHKFTFINFEKANSS